MSARPFASPFYRPAATTFIVAAIALAGIARAAPAASQAPPPDKSAYTLFNPTPRELMREMSTDRPDTTESPYTVDAGHFQLELSFVDWSHDRSDGTTTTTLAAAPLLIKVGLTNSIDLQIGLDPYTRIRTSDAATSETTEGFGDTIARLKVNVFGNDGGGEGEIAFAVMPFIKFPTASDDLGNGDVEWGIILPLAIALPGEFNLGLMAEFDFIRNAADDRSVTDFVHTATISHALIGDLGAFIEYAGFANLNHDEDYRACFDAGLTYALTDNLQLDGGARLGLTDAADDLALFLGLSVRF